MNGFLLRCESFRERGGWVLDTQSTLQLGCGYLMAHGLGVPVADAVTEIEIPSAGRYAVWAENPKHPSFAGTTKSAHAQPIEDALAGKPSNEDWTGLLYWNHGNPIGPALTKENEAEVRAQYYAEIAADDEARRKDDEEPDLAGQHEMPDDH